MVSSDTERIIVKFLSKTATSLELDRLVRWIEDENNQRVFKEFVKTHFAILLTMNQPDTEEVKKKVLNKIKENKRKIRIQKTRTLFKYAAIVLIFAAIGLALKMEFFPDGTNDVIVPRNEQIVLELESGEVQTITGKATDIKNDRGTTIAESDGDKLSYTNGEDAENELVYNRLIVPYGKTYNIVLSDGTYVTLNSGSSLKYPVNFVKKDERRIFLEGEAFFTVVHDKTKPFYVEARGIDVKVYGTEFNLKSYVGDNDTEVVLVNGAVSLLEKENDMDNEEKREIVLEPGDKALFNRESKKITKDKVDTSIYTSWIQGKIVFRNEPFENIARVLERSYNVIMINNNEELAGETFNATIETRYESIEQVLSYFRKVYGVDYSIVENKIIIN